MPSFALISAYIVFGISGIYVFRAGKKNSHPPHLVLGLALMIYPYFVDGALLNWLIGLALMGAVYFLA